MTDLARSLVDAAAEAMAALNPMLIAGQPENYVDDAGAAVVAVLETLAADYEGDGTVYVSVGDLHSLAAEVRGVGEKQ